ncbi:hypothetical protein KUTeg_012774 [Tegillarca granosa]|uniref:Sushi domain-containing protein n=1 Tax=Tegillarca granosa TaxID=220873 RepID=A0ABQ9F0H7_TEGGR|nr:hypothetical protein KUTeg_012774 [Tegillarca granosa]
MVECGQPPNVEHGWYSNTGITPGDVSIYKCKEGYVGIGDERIFCKDDGQWSKSTFVCMEVCGLPPEIPFSKHKINGNMSGAITSYQCQSGYVPVGHPNVVYCPNPPDVLSSTTWKHANKSGVYASYQCGHGFYLVGESTIVCQDGVWSSVKFTCNKYCGLPPKIPFSTHQINGNMSGVVTTYQCDSGYVPVGHPNVVCKSNGEWSTGNFLCLKDCPNPADVLSSTAWKHANKSGVYASYQCCHGFYLVGESTIVCKDGVWSSVKFTCNKYCSSPPYVPHATSHTTGNMSAAIASYRCEFGYAAVGEPNVVCENNGKWSNVKIECLIDCGAPPTKPYAERYYTATYSGSKVIYNCESGYIRTGSTNFHVSKRRTMVDELLSL